jgi:hypothetical protein
VPDVTESPSATTDQGLGGPDVAGAGAGLRSAWAWLAPNGLDELPDRAAVAVGDGDGRAVGDEASQPVVDLASPSSRGADGSTTITAPTTASVRTKPDPSSNDRRRPRRWDGVGCAWRAKAVRRRWASASAGSGDGGISYQRAIGRSLGPADDGNPR